MPTLLVLNGTQKDQVFEVRGGETLGREHGNSIQISAPGISRKHVQFVLEGTAFWVLDLGSANGTAVNGQRIHKHKLADGDVIALSSITMKFQAQETNVASGHAHLRAIRPAPVTETMDTERARKILLEDEKDARESKPDYAIDARSSFSKTDFRLSDKDQAAQLQKRLELLFEVNQALAAVQDQGELLGKIMDKLFEVFPNAHHGLVVLGPTVDDLEPAIVRSRSAKDQAKAPSLSKTIAREVFEQRKAILAHDAAKDDRFSEALSVVGMEIRSFIVAPLLFREEAFGFIQLDTHEARRRFSPDDLALLVGLAASAALFLKSQRLFEAVAHEVKERESIQSELRVASRIQAQLLPKKDPDHGWLELAGRMKTAKEVGGDYYDYLQGAEDLYVVIGDVSGKGVPAGLVMVMARSILRSLTARGVVEPKALAVETNRLLKQDLKPGMFLSLLVGRCDSRARTVRFAGCGHERPFVFRARTGKVERIELGGLVLGVVADNSKNVAEVAVALEPGDQIVLYTDGVPEAMSPDGKQLGLDRFERALAESGRKTPREVLDAIEAVVAGHVKDADPHDDITLIALRRKA